MCIRDSVCPGQEVVRRWVIEEERRHRRGHEIGLVHGLNAENLLNGTSHVDLGVEGALHVRRTTGTLDDVRANDIARACLLYTSRCV